jgi:type VI secretion system secreted protein VgrG
MSKNRAICLAAFVGISSFAAPIVNTINLGAAGSFAVLAGSTITNTGPTVVTGDLGVFPGLAVTGFPPGVISGGAVQVNNATVTQAQADLATAYAAIAGGSCPNNLSGQDLGGLTLTPGVYCFSSSAQLTGILTLDAQGDPNAQFQFQIGSTLTTAAGSTVTMVNGGQGRQAFWQVGSSATLGSSSSFAGNILALTSITLNSGASILHGSVLASNGAVTMDTNIVGSAAAEVPEPSTMILLSLGAALTLGRRAAQRTGKRPQ